MIECSLAKIIKWSFENRISVAVACHKEEGLKDQIEITLNKNGKTEVVRVYDWDELDSRWLSNTIQERAMNLSLTRLVL